MNLLDCIHLSKGFFANYRRQEKFGRNRNASCGLIWPRASSR